MEITTTAGIKWPTQQSVLVFFSVVRSQVEVEVLLYWSSQIVKVCLKAC